MQDQQQDIFMTQSLKGLQKKTQSISQATGG